MDSGSICHDATLILRNILASGLTDPISATRNASAAFIMTSYPGRPVNYPIITIFGKRNGPTEKAGMSSENERVPLTFELRTWGRTSLERDTLSDQVHNTLRTSQQGVTPWSGTESHGLFDYRILSDVNVDEPGIEGIHSKILDVGYVYWTNP